MHSFVLLFAILLLTFEFGTAQDNFEISGLAPEEITERYGHIFEKIDKDSDGQLSKQELLAWSELLHSIITEKESKSDFESHDADNDGFVSFDDLRTAHAENPEEAEDLKERIKIVDKDGDGKLNSKEHFDLFHPADNELLVEREIDSIMKHQDTDTDGKISFDEFKMEIGEEEDVASYQEEFTSLDANKDGFIDRDEVRLVIKEGSSVPVFEDEVKEMLTTADTDSDGSISKEEFLHSQSALVGTKVTDYGELLRYPQDYDGLELPFENLPSEAEELEPFDEEDYKRAEAFANEQEKHIIAEEEEAEEKPEESKSEDRDEL
eukprot:Platyproteum_vivax@DN5750_c0_g1_i2.p1